MLGAPDLVEVDDLGGVHERLPKKGRFIFLEMRLVENLELDEDIVWIDSLIIVVF